jgi:hypothetical protein
VGEICSHVIDAKSDAGRRHARCDRDGLSTTSSLLWIERDRTRDFARRDHRARSRLTILLAIS